MFGTIKNDFCPHCGSPKLRKWDVLTPDEQKVARARIGENRDDLANVKKHRVCARCFRVVSSDNPTTA